MSPSGHERFIVHGCCRTAPARACVCVCVCVVWALGLARAPDCDCVRALFWLHWLLGCFQRQRARAHANDYGRMDNTMDDVTTL